MIFIDDLIENLIFARYGPRLRNQLLPHILYEALRHQVGQRLTENAAGLDPIWGRVSSYGYVEAEFALRRYLERHHESVDLIEGYVIWTDSRIWLPGTGYVKTPLPEFQPNLIDSGTRSATFDVPDTIEEGDIVDFKVAGEQIQLEAKPEVTVTEYRSSATIVDGLPEDIQKPSEAWAWWLQQPTARGQYWHSVTIANKITKISSRFTPGRLLAVRASIDRTAKKHGWNIKIDHSKKTKGYGVSEDSPSFDYRLKSRPLEGYDSPVEHSTDPAPTEPSAPIESGATAVPSESTPAADQGTTTAPELPPTLYETEDFGERKVATSEFDYVDGMMLRWCYYDGIKYSAHRPWPQSLLPYQVFVDQLPAGICDVNSFELYENLAYTLFKFDLFHCYRLDDFEMWCIGLCAKRSFYKDQPWAVMDVQFEAIRQNLIEMGWQRGPINGSSDHYIGPGRLMEANQIADHEGWEKTREVQRKVNEEAKRLRSLRDDQ